MSERIDAELFGGGLRHDGVHAGAELLRAGADEDAAVGHEANNSLRGGAVRGIGGGGHAVADEVVAFDELAGLGISLSCFAPAETFETASV